MSKLLIIGATGFVGGYLAEEAWHRGYEVHITSRKSSSLKYLEHFPIINHCIDIFDEDALRDLLKAQRYDYIIQNAGLVKATREEDFYTVNASFIGKLCKMLIEEQVVPKKLIYVSSLAAFGPADFDPRGVVTHDTIPRPITTYGRSKLQGEELLGKYQSIPHNIIRPTAVYGPRDTEFLAIYKMIAKGYKLYIGEEYQELSFVHVRDLTKTIMDILPSAPYVDYFVSDGNTLTAKAYYDVISSLLEVETKSVKLPKPLLKIAASLAQMFAKFQGKPAMFNRDKLNELTALSWHCDISRLENLGDFSPCDLKEGLRETLIWCQSEKLL